MTADGKPIKGILVTLSFVMSRKNHHGFIFGPSDDSGVIEVSGEEIRREARKEMEIFLMDYADIDTYWTGVLRATPVNRESLKRALAAYRQFRHCEFPPGYEGMLLAADGILSRMPTAVLEARVQCQPDRGCAVEVIAVKVGGERRDL